MKIIGHRGAAGLAPENTLAAIHKALEHGVDGLEIDVRTTKDKMVVLHHGPVLTDAGGATFRINACNYRDLKDRTPDLTTLPEAIAAVNRQVPIIIEVKSGELTNLVVTILEEFLAKDWRAADFRLASFDTYTLTELHHMVPDIGLIVNERWSGVRAHLRARKVGTKTISMNQRWLWWGFIRGFKNSGWELYAYTLNDPVKAKKWERWGLAGVITDYPDRFTKS